MEIAIRRREQEVWQACDDLWALHGDMTILTGDGIRERLVTLGKSRGSPNEIYKYRKTWLKSRGLLQGADRSEEHDSDPITRAVRLVHENLQNEAGEQIAKLKEEFEEQRKIQEDETARAKAALDQVMVEFSALNDERKKNAANILSLEEQLSAEIEIRKSVEREFMLEKTLRIQQTSAHEVLLKELKAAHEQEISKARVREQEQNNNSLMEREKLREEKKQLGHEYSERLNEVRTALYNQEIVNQQQEKKVARLVEEINKYAVENEDRLQQVLALKQENARLSETIVLNLKDVAMLKQVEKNLHAEIKTLRLALKRSEITTARMRAIINR